MPDQYLLSKLFAHALKPVQIEPFFLRASSAPKSRDITVATIMDPSRMENFLRLVDRYPGGYEERENQMILRRSPFVSKRPDFCCRPCH